ncbi:MAG: hypothetical protein KatS3mg047_0554 [Bellilinea sp.]|nr:MAG: hypothetical protein KatS3mg047_0554 [Bellilinea sp.]
MQSVLAFWARSLNCPVCDQLGLDVIREAGVPDLLHCNNCTTEFEVSETGDFIRLIQYPQILGVELYGVWMPFGLVSEKIKAKIEKDGLNLPAMIAVTGSGKPMSRTNLITDDLSSRGGSLEPPQRAVDQARKLIELGNTPAEVRQILEKDPRLNPIQIDRIMEIIEQPARTRSLERILTLIAVIMGLVVIGLLIYPTGVFERALIAVNGLINGERLELIPPPPTVTQYARQGRSFGCPPTQQGAAALFGGKADHWHFDGKNWIYTDLKGIRVYVPEGLSARYSYVTPILEIKSVEGPAVIDPIMAVSIDCYH